MEKSEGPGITFRSNLGGTGDLYWKDIFNLYALLIKKKFFREKEDNIRNLDLHKEKENVRKRMSKIFYFSYT